MWVGRRRSRFDGLDLPTECFISHSYKDAEVRKRLLKLLPKNVNPYVFPPITVSPEQMVSDELLEAIRGRPGLIYLKGGESDASFWVALERDYALRIGKPVYAFDPSDNSLKRDNSDPMDLKVFIASSHYDQATVSLILSTLQQRYFTLQFDEWNIAPWPAEGSESTSYDYLRDSDRIQQQIRSAFSSGGYVVAFWSTHARDSKWVEYEMGKAIIGRADRILFALLDETPLLDALPQIYIRNEIAREYFAHTPPNTVQVCGDGIRPQLQRIDDLIVNLYWLIYRNTRKNQFS